MTENFAGYEGYTPAQMEAMILELAPTQPEQASVLLASLFRRKLEFRQVGRDVFLRLADTPQNVLMLMRAYYKLGNSVLAKQLRTALRDALERLGDKATVGMSEADRLEFIALVRKAHPNYLKGV